MIISLAAFTAVHTAISLVAILAGIVLVAGLPRSRSLPGWTALFLAMSVLTDITGFGFPFHGFLPSHGVGIISLVVLAAVIIARYWFLLAGAARWVYAIGVVLTLYFLVFVGVVQAFLKVPVLQPLAPTQSEPPFAITQIVVLALFLLLAIAAARRFHPRRY